MGMQVKTRHGPQMRDCVLTLAEAIPPPSHKSDDDEAGRCEGDGEASSARGEGGGGRPNFSRGNVRLGTRDSAIAPGQFAAFYRGEECLGAGVISDSNTGVEPPGGVATTVAGSAGGSGGHVVAAEPALGENALVA